MARKLRCAACVAPARSNERANLIFVGEALIGEPVGVIENNDGGWTVSYGPLVLGIIAHGHDRLRKPKPDACGLVDNAARCPQGPHAQQQQG